MSKYITEKVRWQCRVPKWPADNGTVPLPRGEHGCPGSRGDTWSGLGGTKITNHRVEPLHSQATESPEKMQGVLNLDPSCFLGFFLVFFFSVGKPVGLPRSLFRPFIPYSFLFTFRSDDGKLNSFQDPNSHPENLGTSQGYDLAQSGNIWGFTFTHL